MQHDDVKIDHVEVGGSRHSVSTEEALTNFSQIAAEYHQKESERSERLKRHTQLDPSLEKVLSKFKSGHATPPPSNCDSTTTSAYHGGSDFVDLAKAHFPPRSNVKVYITDFYDTCTKTKECRLSEIERYMRNKPKEVNVRWLHTPLGLGPLHSTVEDVFLHAGSKGRPLANLGPSGFPYASIEVLNFCDRERYQQMRDTYHYLHDVNIVSAYLNKDCWTGFPPPEVTKGKGLLDDLKWRTTHLGLASDWNTLPDFWTTCASDISWQLTEGVSFPHYGPLDGLRPTLWQSDTQALLKNAFFESAQLVRDPFRCFHRGDGEFCCSTLDVWPLWRC